MRSCGPPPRAPGWAHTSRERTWAWTSRGPASVSVLKGDSGELTLTLLQSQWHCFYGLSHPAEPEGSKSSPLQSTTLTPEDSRIAISAISLLCGEGYITYLKGSRCLCWGCVGLWPRQVTLRVCICLQTGQRSLRFTVLPQKTQCHLGFCTWNGSILQCLACNTWHCSGSRAGWAVQFLMCSVGSSLHFNLTSIL